MSVAAVVSAIVAVASKIEEVSDDVEERTRMPPISNYSFCQSDSYLIEVYFK